MEAPAAPPASEAVTTSAHGAQHHDHGWHAHEHHRLREVLAERVISVVTLNRGMRLVVALAVVQLVVSALLMALRGVSMPSFIADVTNGEESTIAIAVFVATLLFTTLAWAFILAGSFRAAWPVRVVALCVFGWAMWSEKEVALDAGTATVAICLACVGVITALAVATWFLDRAARRERAAWWPRRRALLVLIVFLLVAAIYAAAWIGARAVDEEEFFTTSFSDQINNLEYFLIPLLVFAGSDFGDWGNLAVNRAVNRVRRVAPSWLFALVTLAVAGAVLFDGVRVAMDTDNGGGGLAAELGLGAVVAVLTAGLFVLARPRGRWAGHLPFLAVAAVAVIDATIGFVVSNRLSDDPNVGDKMLAISALWWGGAAAAGVVLLVAGRRRLPAWAVAATTYVVLIGVTDVLTSLPWITQVWQPFGLTPDNAPFLGTEGLRAVAAMITVVAVLAAVALRRLRAWAVPVGLLLTLTVALQVLDWIDNLYGRTTDVTSQISIAAAIVLVVALLWELTVSGEAITNTDGRWLPRDSRVQMYLGYIVMVASAVLFYGSLHAPGSGALRENQFDSEEWVRGGIIFLGVPLVISLFMIGLERWRTTRGTADESTVHVMPVEAAPVPAES